MVVEGRRGLHLSVTQVSEWQGLSEFQQAVSSSAPSSQILFPLAQGRESPKPRGGGCGDSKNKAGAEAPAGPHRQEGGCGWGAVKR